MEFFFFFPVPVCAITASGVPGGTFVLVPCAGDWPCDKGGKLRGEYDRVSNQDRPKQTPNFTTRWATGNYNFVYSSLWDIKSSFRCRKILRHGTFPLNFPSGRKVRCGFLSPLKIHRLGRVLNPQPLGPVASTLHHQGDTWNSWELNPLCLQISGWSNNNPNFK
jgi:hypothetical protein